MEENARSEMTNRLLGAAGLGVLASVGTALGVGGAAGLLIGFIILLLLVLLFGGFLLWQRLKRQRASDQFRSSLGQEAAQAPREIKDPNRQADLDKLRKRFMDGIDVYRSRGKDLYSVPWFVIIGESGSGKTEAIRHSNLDFPSGLNDFMQGAGGTINMDWWFTNHGVVLDTAGSMVFREMSGEAAGSPQWQEFLKLLKKHRSVCPINGLVLVLSVDSLISDSAARIAEKAGRIARQLDVVQRALDVRFPVSVLVTKCDKLTGFREFFESIEDPELQDQMVGWSNPDALDTPFRADLVDQHLEQVIRRLRKRRLGLLRDPLSAQGPRARRTDEVDALYALPKSLSLIAPRLRRYLETIFVAGEFSAKPVFLRGIYFTSAMQTGADMDEAVWNALGRATTEGETSGTSKRDLGRPFFLRHVFLEKVFRERGLVTRATNTRRMLVRRKLALMGATSACLLLVLLFGWWGKGSLKKQIKLQRDAWDLASSHWDNRSYWNPLVLPAGPDGWAFRYEGTSPVDSESNLAAFHKHLRGHADKGLKIGGIFYPVKWITRLFRIRLVSKDDLNDAQRLVFEHSVVLPLIENTRAKMRQEQIPGRGARSAPAPFQQEALKALIRLEAEIVQGQRRLAATNAEWVGSQYLMPYLCYLTETNDLPQAPELAEVFLRTYAGKGEWPPARLKRGDPLAAKAAIDSGLVRFFENVSRANTRLKERRRLLELVAKQAAEFEAQESKWHRAASPATPAAITPDYLSNLEIAKLALDTAMAGCLTNGLFVNRGDLLESQLNQMRAESAVSGSNAVLDIQAAMTGGAALLTNSLFEEIRSQLRQFQVELDKSVNIAVTPTVRLNDLDANSLRYCDPSDADRSYARRFQIYAQAFNLQKSLGYDVKTLIGSGWSFLTNLQGQARAIGNKAGTYASTCGYAPDLRRTCDYLLEEADRIIRGKLVTDYASHVAGKLAEFDQMPQTQVNLSSLTSCADLAAKVEQDLAAPPGKLAEAQARLLHLMPERLKQAKAGLIQKFAINALAKLGERPGFPILRDGQEFDLPSLQAYAITGLQLARDLSSTTLDSYPPEPLIKKLKDRLAKSQKILTFLFDTTNNMRHFIVRVDANDNKPDDILKRHWGLSVSADGKAEALDIAKGRDFAPLTLSQKLVVVSKPYPASAKEYRAYPPEGTNPVNWAALRLIALAMASPQKPPNLNANVLLLDLKVDNSPTEVLKVQLVFEQPLSLFNEWSADW